MNEKRWFAFDVTTAPHSREAIEYGLMEAGALGTETVDSESDVRVTGYFENPIDENRVRRALADAYRIYKQVPSEIDRIDFKVRAVADRDWLAEWKKSWQPVQVGRFIVAPPWLVSVPGGAVSEPRAVATGSSDSSGSLDPLATALGSDTAPPGSDTPTRGAGTIVIQINPGMAFGTGTHETTRLCLKAIDKYYRGETFLDVGTGTGVLAIAAAMCQKPDREGECASINAYDTDADAIEIAKQNAQLNDVSDRIDFQVGTVDEQTPSVDFVCANLTAPVIVELLPALVGATCGRLVLSGILDSQEETVRSRLAELGINECEVDRDGEWIAVVA